jgi:ABC-type multidrug transport system ATPase subunit
VRRTLDELDLTGSADVRVGDLSGGQRKRVSIGVELLTSPQAFFLDEPTSGLDPATAASLMGTLRRLAGGGTTIGLTTHNTDDLRVCDRLVVVAGGRIVFTGSPEEARRHFDVEHLADVYLRTATDPPAPLDRHARAPQRARSAARASTAEDQRAGGCASGACSPPATWPSSGATG